MYGFKGGDASQVQYPTVNSVRKEFYDTYPEVLTVNMKWEKFQLLEILPSRLNGK